jgi:hypothetical protein
MAIEQDAMSNEEIIENYLFQEDVPEKVPSEEEVVEASEEEVEDDSIEEEGSEEVKEDEVDEDEKDSSERWMPESLDELASAMEVEPDDLKSIRVKTKVDGVEGEATLAEVIKNYQINKSLTERSEQFAHERKQFEDQTKAALEHYQTKLQEAESMTQIIEERLRGEVQSVDWDQLRRENPAEYAVKRQDFVERIGEVESMKQAVIAERQEQMQKQQQQFQEQHQEFLRKNQELLLDSVPEWRDEAARKTDMQELKAYLQSQNISDQEINGIVDYRMVVLAKKAKAYDEMQTKASPAKAMAKTKPKFTKPGTVKSKSNAQDGLTKKRIQRASKTQTTDDWARVLEDILN